MVEEKGEIPFSGANDLNIPVNIWLLETKGEDGKKDGTWTLRANNFLPRKDRVETDMYEAVSEKREELVDLIKKHILPLYETAVKKLQAVCNGTGNELYFWGD